MTIATALLAALAFVVIFWQETLLRKRENTIDVLREEIKILHDELRAGRLTAHEPHKP